MNKCTDMGQLVVELGAEEIDREDGEDIELKWTQNNY